MGAVSPSYIWIKIANTSFSPADSTTYYLGGSICTPTTAANLRNTYPMVNGCIEKAYVFCICDNAPSNENIDFIIRLNDTTDYAITTLACATEMVAYVQNLNIPVTTSSYIEFKVVCPALAINPITWRISIDLLVRV